MRLWILVGFHSSLIPDNSREAATARLPWAPQIFRARVTGFGQVFMSTDWRIKLYCTVLYFTTEFLPDRGIAALPHFFGKCRALQLA